MSLQFFKYEESLVKALERQRLPLVEFSHQILVENIDDKDIFDVDIMNVYRFTVDVKDNIMIVEEEKTQLLR